jgi:ATP-binding cassette subfamily B protein
MAITGIGATILGFILMIVILSKSQKYFKVQQEQLGAINGHIEEIYSGHNVVKVYNGIKNSNKIFDKINNELYDSAKKSQFLSGLMQPIMSFIGNFGYVAICVVGAALVIDNKITMGVIASFMIYTRLFMNPLSTIAQAATQLQSAAAASERVFKFLKEEELEQEYNKKEIRNAKGTIEFNNVKFGYNKDKTIIKDFSAVARPGQKIAIVGPTGAGKTTMVNLLMRFYEIDKGTIKIDGTNIKEVNRENVHDLFCMVLQDTWVFEGTIKENIIFNKKGITDKQVENACKVVGLDHFIKSLPEGYDTVLGDSESLSQGQKQLLTIARSMLDNAPFLILDEATSNVDTRTEELVQKAMDKLTVGRTSFIIAHRLSTIRNADLILVMKNGNIIEQGTHDELIDKKGFYEELYNSQFQN